MPGMDFRGASGRRPTPWAGVARFSVVALALALAACNDSESRNEAPVYVTVATVSISEYAPQIALTGDIRARNESDLGFRVGGRMVERFVDVGDHVSAGQVLARIDPQEQAADLAAAEASVTAAEAQVQRASATFDRQKQLLTQGFTTQRDFDSAQEGLRTARGQLDAAVAQRQTAREALSYAELRSPAAGIITQRNAEAGQYAQAAQPIFKLAEDGPRDAVFAVDEATLLGPKVTDKGHVALLSDPRVTATGTVREMSPTVDTVSGTVRIKVGLDNTPDDMKLGMAVVGTANLAGRKVIALPSSALWSKDGEPAVWVLGADGASVSPRVVSLVAYGTSQIYLDNGILPGERIVTKGVKLLRPGLKVTLTEGQTS